MEPSPKRRKLNPNIQYSTIHLLDVRQLIAYNLPLKDQLAFNSITKKCYEQINQKERKSANELHILARGVVNRWDQLYKEFADFDHYKEMEKYGISVVYTTYNPLILNTMDNRTFINYLDALIWLFDNFS